MKLLSIASETSPDRATIAAIGDGPDGYNEQFAPNVSFDPNWVVGQDADGTVQAGTRYLLLSDWMFVDWPWVAASYRRVGVGSQPLEQAEARARDGSCTKVYLDTFSFQAPAFYARHGYREFARLPGFPCGDHERIWLWKTL